MACPGVGPCAPYDINLTCLTETGSMPDPCLLDGDPVPQPIIDNAKIVASQILWALTGRQFGLCTVTIRPCRMCNDPCCLPEGNGNFPTQPFMQSDGSWVNLTCGCVDECSCTNIHEVRLPYPACSVDEVLIDGEIVDDTTYTIYNFYKLVRLGGADWPQCNDLTKPDSEPGTWSITVTYGREVPELVELAAGEMACEIIKSLVGKPCKLPQRISSVSRQGVTVSFLDSMDFFDKGLSGLYFVDLAARTYNPKRLLKRAAVYSPDIANKWKIET